MKMEIKYISPRRLSTFLDKCKELFAPKSTTVSSVKIDGGKELRKDNDVVLPIASAENDGMMSAKLYEQVQLYMVGDIDLDGGRAGTVDSDYAYDMDGGGA
ncbi:hypothetical protein DWZ40_13075 [Clostridium sp. AF32-12BH]|nr:hypothetical protein DWZ40_13075 [Clostridium sp. AF32-12BH]